MSDKTDEVMEELMGLTLKQMEETLEYMNKGEPIKVNGNVYMMPKSFALFLEEYIRLILGIDDGIPRNKES